jgi:hypothetical protein
MTIADNLPRETKKFAVTDIAATAQGGARGAEMFEGEAALPQLFNVVVDVLTKLDAVANVPSQWPEKTPVKARTMIVKEVRATLARFRGLRDRAEVYTEKNDREVP